VAKDCYWDRLCLRHRYTAIGARREDSNSSIIFRARAKSQKGNRRDGAFDKAVGFETAHDAMERLAQLEQLAELAQVEQLEQLAQVLVKPLLAGAAARTVA
jgi:hypothetical protein